MIAIFVYCWLGLITAVALPVLGAVLYFLGYWARVTEWLWSRYSEGFGRFMHCAACSGTWYVFALAAVAWWVGLPVLILPSRYGAPPEFGFPWWLKYLTPFAAALWGTYWVPRFARPHLGALRELSSHSEYDASTSAPAPEASQEQ